ncbi:MAG: DUF4173 domain-containing protein [Patescibacteria group bacterium]|nr:DUF4173 domain-containing protein [Patescibacteria group bacterium]
MENIKHTEKFNKELLLKLIFSAVLAIFWVVFLWNFWHKGIYALGFNATAFGLLFLGLFVWVLYKKGQYIKHDLFWIIPMVLIFLSYSIYDNPFLKIISILILPAMFTIFFIQSFLTDKKTRIWDFEFILKVINRFFTFPRRINQTVRLYLNLIIPAGKTKKNTIFRIATGIILFLIIALTVFIPLLSSADAIFADKMQVVNDWFLNIFSSIYVYKLLTVIVLSVLFFSVLNAWSRKFDYKENDGSDKNIDPIVSGIVLGGVLCLYLLFLWVQANRLWIGVLPFDFKETESLVKGGFWQLLFLSIINILIYFFVYRKTSLLVQQILTAFTVASLFLLVSAGYRMGLYVIYYGFSYEKFFASYAVIYCAILFVWLIIKLFSRQRANILKFVIVLFLWMYAVVAILPVEQFILRTNIALVNIKDSRIRLFELTMLSPDVLSLIKKYERQGMLKENSEYLPREIDDKNNKDFDWGPWIENQEKLILDKAWYEKNLTNFVFEAYNKKSI